MIAVLFMHPGMSGSPKTAHAFCWPYLLGDVVFCFVGRNGKMGLWIWI